MRTPARSAGNNASARTPSACYFLPDTSAMPKLDPVFLRILVHFVRQGSIAAAARGGKALLQGGDIHVVTLTLPQASRQLKIGVRSFDALPVAARMLAERRKRPVQSLPAAMHDAYDE